MEEFPRFFHSDFTYLSAFMRNVERNGEKRALTCTSRNAVWTYGELNREANRLAHALTGGGCTKGDVAMCCLLNTAEYVFCWLGAQKAGVVFSPINFRLSEGEIAVHLVDSRPRVLLYDESVCEVITRALAMSRHKPEITVMVGDGALPGGSRRYRDWVGGEPDSDPVPDVGPFDEIVRLYTSGTTGNPKGVPLNNINNLMRSYDVMMHFPLSPLDRTLNMTPWFHAGGLHSGGPCPTLHAGAELVALKAFNPKTVLDCVEHYRLTFLIGAPANLEMLAAAQRRSPRDLSSLKGIVTMGAPLSREACLRYHEVLTPNIFNGYGTTETFWNSFLRPYDLPARAGTAGRPCTDDRVRVVRIPADREMAEPDELAAADGLEEGEVIVQTLKAPYRYHNKPEEDQKQYYRGWYYTKDIATWDKDGFITICGRRDDMIISEGENIHPAQVEAVINEMPQVEDSIVVGTPDPVRGEALAAYVVKKEPDLTGRELLRYLTDHPSLARFKRPRYVKFVSQLPLTATGKKKYFVVRQWAADDLKSGRLKRP